MISAMEAYYGTCNIVNGYIEDNKKRFQTGIAARKTPEQIEREWSQGMMESLGYRYVEAAGAPRGSWDNIKVHWFKVPKDALHEQG